MNIIHCKPFRAKISPAACASNLETAIKTAKKINKWKPAWPDWKADVPFIDDIELSRFAACSKCAQCSGNKILSSARHRLSELCKCSLYKAESVLSIAGRDTFDGHDHGDFRCAP